MDAQVNQRQDETPEQLLNTLAGEVSYFSKSISIVVERAFPNLTRMEASSVESVRAVVDTVLYMELYAPVMDVLHKVDSSLPNIVFLTCFKGLCSRGHTV